VSEKRQVKYISCVIVYQDRSPLHVPQKR